MIKYYLHFEFSSPLEYFTLKIQKFNKVYKTYIEDKIYSCEMS